MSYKFTDKQLCILAKLKLKYAISGPTYPTNDGSYIMHDNNTGMEITSTDYALLYPVEHAACVEAMEQRFWELCAQDMLAHVGYSDLSPPTTTPVGV